MFDSLFNLFTFSLFILQLSTSWVWQRQSLRFAFMASCFSSRIKADSPLHNESVPSTPQAEGGVFLSPTLKRFSFSELKTGTKNFRNTVGEGPSPSVFKGWVNGNSLTAANPGSGMVVAVKRLNENSDRAHMKWSTEMNYAQRLHHPNLVKLIGFCSEDNKRLLVYEFMPCGSLDSHLFRRASNSQPLSWTVRMKIALGAAKVLAFFHSDDAKVIYRNFQSSHILLDSNYNAKLCDLGLATRTDINRTSRKFKGTRGYAAPEYLAAGLLSSKCDVYGFGVVMLEMMTGRRVLDRSRPSTEHNLVEWAKPYLYDKRKVQRIIDFRIQGTYTAAEARKAAKLVILCLSKDPQDRPNMNDVVKTLEHLQKSSGMDGPR